MNAGAYGYSIGELVQEVRTMDYKGNLRVLHCRELEFSYRWSNLQQQKMIILGGVLQLLPGDREELQSLVQKNRRERRSRQPLLPSAGSIFRNPPGGLAAGKLIDELEVKGLAVGGAMVSPEHANFIVNAGNATASDVLSLIELIQKKVRSEYKIELELEIKVVGENSRG